MTVESETQMALDREREVKIKKSSRILKKRESVFGIMDFDFDFVIHSHCPTVVYMNVYAN